MENGRDFFEKNLGVWKDGQQCESFMSILASKSDYFKDGVSNVIAFGCGSFVDIDDDELNTRSSVQHASLLTIREFLREVLDDADDKKILAQDPAYTPTDKEILKKWEIETVDDPDGFLELDDRSVVFTCSPSAPIKQIVMDICRPLVLICNTVVMEDDPVL
jgi:SRR1